MRSRPQPRYQPSIRPPTSLHADERTKLDFPRNQTEVPALHTARMLKFKTRMHLKVTVTWTLIVGDSLNCRHSHRRGASNAFTDPKDTQALAAKESMALWFSRRNTK